MEANNGLLQWIFGPRRASAAPGRCTLADAPARRRLRVEAIHTDPARADRLASLGLVAGCELRLRQRYPAPILDLGSSTLALDGALARAIHVTLL